MQHAAWRLVGFVALALIATGCSTTGAVIGAGASAGVAGAQERGFRGTVSDAVLTVEINELWFRTNHEMFGKVDATVVEGRALLTGRVPTPDMRVEAVRLAWQVDGLKEIINEIEVADRTGLFDGARDLWISTQLRAQIIFDREISAINYSIDTVNGVVFLMGIARDQAELDRVANHARNLSNVRRVMNYVRLRDDPKRRS
ncbi:MAG: BON domain-containing protein [Proteobacteria bacterium]|nr:BON domain-containing protein [Pseudomonadota bacterium]MBI3498729.1 BON domain-containing protein [Pseudomonadota bacterium]